MTHEALVKGQGPRKLAERALIRVAREDAFTSMVLDALFSQTSMSARDRGLATELCYGVLRQQRRIDRALDTYARKPFDGLSLEVKTPLRVAAYQMLFLDRVPAHAAVNYAVSSLKELGGKKLAGFGNGLLRELSRQGEGALPDDDSLDSLGVRSSLPTWLVEEVARRLSFRELEAACLALTASPPLWARVARHRITTEELIEHFEEEEIPALRGHYPFALELGHFGKPDSLRSFQKGLWSIQDESAQISASFASPGKARCILDLCAGVGGKTLHFRESNPTARIIAVDINRKKLRLLEESAQRLGIDDIDIIHSDARRYEGNKADLVVVDAPCSGLGVLRRHPEKIWSARPKLISEMVAVQRTLLDAAAEHVEGGGHLLYCVCTFTEEEGPEQAADFAARHPDFERVGPGEDFCLSACVNDLGELALWPHLSKGDAFFAVLFRRKV